MALHLPDRWKPRPHLRFPRSSKNSRAHRRVEDRFRLPGWAEPVQGQPEMEGSSRWASRPPRSPIETPPRPSVRPRSVTLLLPSLNEEAAVGSVIDRVPVQALRRSGYRVHVYVVDGQSTDATPSIARGRGAEVFVQTGKGKGNGVRQALDHLMSRPRPAPSDRFYVMLDADGSYPPEQMGRLLDALAGGADVVLGSRFLGHIEEGAITGLNRLGNHLLSAFASLLFGVPVSDVCTGMWGFREGCLRELGLGAQGFDLEADLYSAACEVGARIAEVPVDYRCRIGEPKLIPLRTGFLIASRLLLRRLNRPQPHLARASRRPNLSAEGPV